MKKSILACAGLLAIACLTSCDGGSGGYDINNFLPNGTADNPNRIVNEPVKIKIFAPKSTSNPEFDTMKMFKYLSQVTGLEFEFTTPASGDSYNTQRAACWNDKSSLPDLFLFNNPIADLVKSAEMGYDQYTPFDDDNYTDSTGKVGNLINNYMPTYKKLLENNFNLDVDQAGNAKDIATVTGKNGKQVMLSTLCCHDVPRDMTYKLWINNYWIANCYKYNKSGFCRANDIQSAEDIETLDEYLGVLREFKSFDANMDGTTPTIGGSGVKEEIPVSTSSNEYFKNFILATQGYVTDAMQLETDGKKFTFVPETNAYREYLKISYDLYKDKILDNALYSNSDYTAIAKNASKGLVGSFEAAAPYLVTTQGTYTELKGDRRTYRLDEAYAPVLPLTSSVSSKQIHWGFGYFTPDGTTIPTTSVYKREVARLIDIMYSDLGCQLIAYGVENEDWKWDNKEKTSWTFKVPKSWKGSQEDYRATITPNVGTGSALYWKNDFVGKMNDDVLTYVNESSEKYAPYLYVPVPSKYKFSSSQYATLTTLETNINNNLALFDSQFIKGSKNPYDDDTYNKFKSDMWKYATDKTSGDTIEDIYNTLLK